MEQTDGVNQPGRVAYSQSQSLSNFLELESVQFLETVSRSVKHRAKYVHISARPESVESISKQESFRVCGSLS